MSSTMQKVSTSEKARAFDKLANETAKAVKRVCIKHGYNVFKAIGYATNEGEVIIKITTSDSGSIEARTEMFDTIARVIKRDLQVKKFIGNRSIPYMFEMNGQKIAYRRTI